MSKNDKFDDSSAPSDAPTFSRRRLASLALLEIGVAATATACSSKSDGDSKPPLHPPTPEIPLPPTSGNLSVLKTACDYCIVGCGFEVYRWPVGEYGTVGDNGFQTKFPTPTYGRWPAPGMLTVVEYQGKPHHVAVVPAQNDAVNVGGDYSVRGGTLAQKLYAKDRDTRDRLLRPRLRVGDKWHDIDWDSALSIVAELSTHVIAAYGAPAWALKMYSYNYYENTYALTKLALAKIATPAWAPHDKPAASADTPGLTDAGINAFSASYEDWRLSDVIFVSGVSLYDAKSILFNHCVRGKTKLIVVNPRRDLTADYAIKNGGMHLQLIPGTDTVLHNAIARIILEAGWQDEEFINNYTVNPTELALEKGFRRKLFGMTFADYRRSILEPDSYRLDQAAAITGVDAALIEEAARRLAAPVAGVAPKASFMLEKGNYWTHNYDNTASLASLGLLVGAGGRPGRVISRAGGHQRGMMSAAGYPSDASPDEFEGNKIPLNVDRWVAEGKVRLGWIVGTTWFAAMGASGALAERVRELTTHDGLPQLTSEIAFGSNGSVNGTAVIERLKARMAAGGMVLVNQDIYPNAVATYADLVLPAAGWGEDAFTRMQGERRLRFYDKITDPPGEAKPDWWIVAEVAKRMGYTDFAWQDTNAIFEEAAARSVGTEGDYQPLVEAAQQLRVAAHAHLRDRHIGIQCPIQKQDGQLKGTVRLHDGNIFATTSKKAIFARGSWSRIADIQAALTPNAGELWVTNMRINAVWQSLYDDARIPQRRDAMPANMLEIHPGDAKPLGIESGDWVVIENNNVLTATGAVVAGRFRGLAYVTDAVRRGVVCSYFNFGGKLESAVNNLTSAAVDPVNPVYRHKLAKGTVRREGPSEFKNTLSFEPRNVAG